MDGTFEPGLPTSRDRIRLALGDTSRPFDLADDTIDATLTYQSDDLALSAAVLADSLASLYARRASETTDGPIKRVFGQRSTYFFNLAISIRNNGFPGEVDPDVTQETGFAVGQLTAPTLEGYRPF